MDKLSFDEIKNWEEFENLAVSYFRKLKEEDNNISDVEVLPTGRGSDGGRDIFVKLQLGDGFGTFDRKWVIQCKFHNGAVNKSHLSDINIPTLIHQYGASGYLLICKIVCSSPVTQMFEKLEEQCIFKYKYKVWNGYDFTERLLIHPTIIQQYFPTYYEGMQRKSIEAKRLLESQK